MSVVIQCSACGGSVVYDAKKEAAACIFCGAVTLEKVVTEEEPPVPHDKISFEVDDARADEEYRRWANSSWWYPKALRMLSVDLKEMYLPAWCFKANVETHWAGLVSAPTSSGKRPVSGSESTHLEHMIPASEGLNESELNELLPYDESRAVSWRGTDEHLPYELPGMSESRARHLMHDLMCRVHQERISAANGLLECKASAVVSDQNVTLYMLPIYIGAFRFRDRPWRFVINAQSGQVTGDAPIDRVKVALVTLGSIVAVALVIALFL